uniref:NPC intracellular cholesterol transporter 2 n=1 Tax=Ciona savignyi TaxID=51511 RepID=H2YI48_CIOSA
CVVRMKIIIFLTAVFVLAECAVVFKDCGSKVGKITGIAVSGCSDSPCNLVKGKNYTVNVTFTTMEATDSAYAYVYGILDGVSVPFPLPQPDGCMSNLKCPLKSNQTYVYSATLPVLSLYPDVKLVVKWELQDAKSGGNDLFCFETPISVTG